MTQPIPTLNDGSGAAPRLRSDLCLCCLGDLPEWSTAPREQGDALLARIREAGFEGVQGGEVDACRRAGLACTTGGRIDRPGEVYERTCAWRDAGFECATLHVGDGFEDDATCDALAEAIVAAAERARFPLYLETHRATITQDMQRTLRLAARFPELRFNGDFSHWYTGQEMRYGNRPIAPLIARLAPVLERTRFLHGRIGNGGSMQIEVDPARDRDESWFQHWRALWGATFAAFKRTASPGDVLPFAPELLGWKNFYARRFKGPDGAMREESDRWQQAQVLRDLAQEWFAAA